jgi:hypothetical protein
MNDLLAKFSGGDYRVLKVQDTLEVKRIRALPTYSWDKDPNFPQLKAWLNGWLQHTPARCEPRCSCCKLVDGLNNVQVAGLVGAFRIKHGMVGALRVGAGKTLLGLLIPTVLSIQGPIVLLGPAKLEKKTLFEGRDYAKHWRCAPVKVITYETLSHPANLEMLQKLKPAAIIADECHKAGPKTKAWKRIRKYVIATAIPYFPMTGSLSDRDIMVYWTHVLLSLRDCAPMPRDLKEALVWAQAINEKIPDEARAEPGALLTLGAYDPADPPEKQARNAYRARFTSTPGIVSSFEDVPPIKLEMSARKVELPQSLMDVIAAVRKDMVTPDGIAFSSKMDLWRHSRTLGAGLFYHWDPAAPEPWKRARRELHKFVTEYLRYHGKTMDSAVHVLGAISKGELNDGGLLARWQEIEPAFEPNPVHTWVDDTLLNACATWLQDKDNDRGLVWVEFRPFGERLAAMTGIPYYSKGGCDTQGRLVDHHKGGPAIVSIKCREGHNLQHWFDRSLFSVPPPKGGWVEQAVGRYHRTPGQEAEEVTAEFLLTTQETFQSLRQCVRDARMDEQSHGQPRKLSYAESTCSLFDEIRDVNADLTGRGV